jgi:D-alanyl-D-alanine-carboxypeptidase/D-alanyl-D-alanine-endopeptidase
MMHDTHPREVCDDAIRSALIRRVDLCGLSPAMVVGTVDAGRQRFISHGWASAAGAEANENTLFEIGSVTKLFTAIVLADMAGRGEAALDDPVAALLPGGTVVPEHDGHAITLAQLATHTSGLPRLPADITVGAPDPHANYTADRLYAFLAGHRLSRKPGADYEYSNLGAGLLGHALARRAGLDYEAMIRRRILAPLGMTSTAVALPPALAARLATGHNDSLDPVSNWDLGVLAGAGGLRSSAADLLLFVEALMDPGSPIGAAAAMLMAPRPAGGLGLGESMSEGHVVLQHEGGTGGFRSHVGCVPAWRRGAVVLANAATGAAADLGVHLCDPRWAMQWYRQPVEIDPRHFDRLLGCYRISPDMLFDVTRADDRLMVQLTGQPAFRVFPLSEWQMFYKVVGAQITFEPGPDGRAVRLVLHQNSRDQIAERID